MGALFVGQKGLVHFFAVADANDLDFVVGVKEFPDGLCQHFDGAGRGFLDHDVPILSVFEGEEDELHGFFQAHDETGHFGFGDGQGLAAFDLLDEQGDHGSPGAHDVAVTGAADQGLLRVNGSAFCHKDFFHHGLGGAHGVDGIGGFIGGQTDDFFDAFFDGSGQHVVSADNVGLDGLNRKKLAGGHLFQGGGVEDVIHAVHGVLEALKVPHIPDVIFDFVIIVLMAHVILFFLIS